MRDSVMQDSQTDASQCEEALAPLPSDQGFVTDPLTAIMEKVRRARTPAELRAILHPKTLFKGLEDVEATEKTVLGWVASIDSDRRDHREIGSDSTFSIHYLIPVPFREAILTVARREGWPAEALLLCIQSNVGWLEGS